jgi:hypothetical protein
MMSEAEMAEQPRPQVTRRTVVATGAKLAYAAPIVAASFKVSGVNAQAISPVGGCFHSTGTNGGCMPTCTSVVEAAGCTQAGQKCGVICGTGQSAGACPVGQGGDNPCCNAGYCDPANFEISTTCEVSYTGPTQGCPPL